MREWIVGYKEHLKEAAIAVCQFDGLIIKEELPFNKLLVEGKESEVEHLTECHCIGSVKRKGEETTQSQSSSTSTSSSKSGDGFITGRVNRKKPHGGSALFPQGPRGTFHIFEDGEALCGRAGSVERGTFLATEAELRSGEVRQGMWRLAVCGKCKSIHL